MLGTDFTGGIFFAGMYSVHPRSNNLGSARARGVPKRNTSSGAKYSQSINDAN
jgi:hypothetical protein